MQELVHSVACVQSVVALGIVRNVTVKVAAAHPFVYFSFRAVEYILYFGEDLPAAAIAQT